MSGQKLFIENEHTMCDDWNYMNTPLKEKLLGSVVNLSAWVLLTSASALADVPAVPAGSPSLPLSGANQQPGGLMAFAPFVLMFAVVYFLILRPQQKKMKEQQTMVSALKQGDEIVTASGFLGKVTGVAEKVVTLELADGVRVKMLKSQVSQVVTGSIKDLA